VAYNAAMTSGTAAINEPSDAVIAERARSFATEWMWALDMQRQRIRECNQSSNVFAWWTDLQFFIVALMRFRRSVELATRVASLRANLLDALADFDAAVPHLKVMRNVGEHMDDYVVGSPRSRHNQVRRRELQVGQWDGTTYKWLDHELNVEIAISAAQQLLEHVRQSVSHVFASRTKTK